MKNRFIPNSTGTFLLNNEPVRVIFAWSRCSYIVTEGQQAGRSVAMVDGTWEKIEEKKSSENKEK